jgi:Big-like domain-containing protein
MAMASLNCRWIGCLLLSLLLAPAGFSKTLAGAAPSEDQSVESASAAKPAVGADSLHTGAPSEVFEPAPKDAPTASTDDAKKDKTFATEDDLPASRFVPMLATTGTVGLFNLETGETLPKRGLVFSAFGNKFGRMPGSVTILATGLDFSYGITDNLNFYAGFDPYGHVHVGCPGQLSLRSIPLAVCTPQNFGTPVPGSFFPYVAGSAPGYVEDYPFASNNNGGIGNITLGLKYAFTSERKGAPVSFSVRNDLVVSSRTDVNKLLNNGTQGSPLSDLVSLALSKQWSNHFAATFNFGYMFVRAPRDSQDAVLFAMPDQLRVGVGIVSFPQSRVQLLWEYSGTVFVSAPGTLPDTSFGARDPIEGVYGLRVYPAKHLGIDLAYVRMLNMRDLNDRNGFVVKIGAGYSPAKTAAQNHPPTISCAADKSAVTADSDSVVMVSCNAADPDNDPLTYSWSSTGGKVDGSGPTVRWRAQGAAQGAYTVTAKVDDGRGGFASGSVMVRVEPKP